MTTPEPQPDSPTDREAAKYRRRLRDVEAERDTLTQRLTASHRAQADTLITDMGVKPQALWATGTAVDALLDDEGNLDPELVAAAVQQATEDLGITVEAKRQGMRGLHSGATKPPEHVGGWADAFTPKG